MLRMLRAESEYRRATRNLQREERDQYSNYLWNMIRLDMGPKVPLTQLVGESGTHVFDPKQEDDLSVSVDYYVENKSDELIQVLRFFAAYLLQHARQARQFSKQLFYLFKAVDLLRMIVQYSPFSINYDAEAIVGGVFIDLGSQRRSQFYRYMETEARIVPLMRQLHSTPNNHNARLAMADLLVRQTSLFDAFLHYQALLRYYPTMRIESDRRRGHVLLKIAEILQGMAERSTGDLKDGRKLRNFVDRYNRDYAAQSGELPRIGRADMAEVRRLQRGLQSLANRYYQRVLAVTSMEPRILVQITQRLGENLLMERRFGESVTLLADGYKHFKGLEETPATMEKRLDYLDVVVIAANRARNRQVQEWAGNLLSDYRKLQTAHSAAEAERKRKRAELLGEDEDLIQEEEPESAAPAKPARGAMQRRPPGR